MKREAGGQQLPVWVRVPYYSGLFLAFGVGVWHFFVPWLYEWFVYIPPYENLIVGIEWTNYFFSLLLTGLSLLLMLYGRQIFGCDESERPARRVLRIFYGFSVFVWLNRFLICFIRPWPLEPIAWAAYGQLLAAALIFLLQLVPLLALLRQARRDGVNR
ncbi:MAG: hypothetical protein QM270_07380 [Bacillota bacterium]|nr:hypothetical protein [Bacillota bacterium]